MDKQKYIQDAIDKLFTTWLRRSTGFGALIFLLLSILDFVVFREHFARFLVYRLAVASFLLLIAFLAGKTDNRKALRAFALAAVAASAVAIEAMILHAGGYHSSYATGMILLAVIALAFLPAEVSFHASAAALIYGIYFFPIIRAERIDDISTFIATNFFMCSIILTVLVFRWLSMQTVRKQLGSEYELRRLSAEREAVLDNIASGVFLLKSRLVTWANRKAAGLFGYLPEEIIRKDTSIFYPDRESFEQLGREAYPLLAQGKVYSTEREMKKKGGELIWCSIVGQAINAVDLEQGAIWLLDDITERKRIEEELKKYQAQLEEMVTIRTADHEKTIAQLEAEVVERIRAESALERNRKLLHGVFESIQDGIAVLDTEQNIIMTNSAVERFFACNGPIRFKVNKCFEVYRGAAHRCENCVSVRAMDKNTIESEIIEYNLGVSGAGFLEVFTFPFYGDQGEIKGVIQHLRDITGRVLADNALKESEERFKRLLDAAPIAISIVNGDDTVGYLNQKHIEIMGYDLQDIPTLEHWWSRAYPGEPDRAGIRAAWQELRRRVSQGEKIVAVDRKVVCKDGTIKELELGFRAAEDKIIVAFGDITERKRAEEKLQESENRFRTLFEQAGEGILLLSLNEDCMAVNKAYARMHGYSLEEIQNLCIWDLDVNLDPQIQSQRLSRMIREGGIVFEVEHRHKAGHTFPLEVSADFIELNNENFYLCFHRDISDRKKAEKELQEKEAKMSAMLESFDGLIYICSPDYRVEFMNENLIRRTGRTAVGEPCHAVLNDRDSICPWCVNEAVFGGNIVRYEIQSPKDGQWYYIVNTPIRHADNSVSKLAMILDVTERKKTEISLKESEERYRRLVSSVTDYIYTVKVEDGRPVATEHGEGCYAVTGYSSEQYQSDPDLWYRMVYADDRSSVLEMAGRVIAGEKVDPLEHRIVHRDGSVRWVRNTPARSFDGIGRIIAFDGLISDITERKMLEEQLNLARQLEEENMKKFSRLLIEAQEEEQRAIARELHDEIGQSLTGLKLCVESIADSLQSDEADDLRAVEASLGEMLATVRNMSLKLRPAMLDDFGLVSSLHWYFDRYKSQTGIQVNFRQTGASWRFDQQKEITLYRITQEALTNAARHAGVKTVFVELIIEPDRITLRIKDEGRGFDTEKMAYSGSGLSIMRERSILLNGTFSLCSHPEKGTEITVTLPLHGRENGPGGIE